MIGIKKRKSSPVPSAKIPGAQGVVSTKEAGAPLSIKANLNALKKVPSAKDAGAPNVPNAKEAGAPGVPKTNSAAPSSEYLKRIKARTKY